ncbi:DUF1513 domain-containing protein [Atopomonas sediminilitoris]|uniref:DUF1513 domain-containing protein n=1 Tax=Atopomonas sediminilitoris TaxID=2919919 RepID=UPI001F4E7E79|nr:DUF1513 domain-containing protein [Atopomonas sediminilitoris]MCJ8168715.1 DUF1513 domain-containing protein [Atopomonas sediminilitoris]
MNRRQFLAAGIAGLSATTIGHWLINQNGTPAATLFSARSNAQGQHFACAWRLNGEPVFERQITQRCHDILPLPDGGALFIARRPGTALYRFSANGHLLHTQRASADRHYYGHAVLSQDGHWIYASENDTRDPGRGVIGVYRLSDTTLSKEAELSTHGIGPHQLLWLPTSGLLAIANGGIRTEADSRQAMNLGHMQASLVLLSADGRLVSQETLAEPKNSLRHMAVAADDTLVCGQQYMGPIEDRVDLLAIKRPNQPLKPFPVLAAQRQGMQQYTASLAIHEQQRVLAVTLPRGNRVQAWQLDSGELVLDQALPDCAGIAAVEQGFVVSSGQSRCRLIDLQGATPRISALTLPAGGWDNHWRLS